MLFETDRLYVDRWRKENLNALYELFNDAAIKKYASKLEQALQHKGVEYFGNFRFLGYNAPYQFWNRKNEIIVSVHWQ